MCDLKTRELDPRSDDLAAQYDARLRSLYEQLGTLCERVASEAAGDRSPMESEGSIKARIRVCCGVRKCGRNSLTETSSPSGSTG